MEGEEREAAVIDEVVLRMSWVGRTSMSCMQLKVRKSPTGVQAYIICLFSRNLQAQPE